MRFDYYQERALQSAVYPKLGNNLVYPALGLMGEAGEVAEKIKKHWRKTGEMGRGEVGSGLWPADKLEALRKELGDVLWYIAAICNELHVSMDSIAEENLVKLHDRLKRNTIVGEGDTR